MPERQVSNYAMELPLWRLLEMEPGYLRHELERMAREFGYHQTQIHALNFGQATVSVQFHIRQPWTPDDD